MSKSRSHGCFTAAAIALLGACDKVPLKKSWFPLMRREYGVSASENFWAPMLRGEPAPHAMLEAFADEIAARTGGTLNLKEHIVEAPTHPRKADDPSIHTWSAGLFGTLGWVRTRFIETDDSHCQTLEEVRISSEHIVRDVGRSALRRKEGNSPELELKAGEEVMNLKVDDFDAWRLKWWKRDPRVLFATEAGDTVVIPLTDDAAERFRTGEANDTDLDPTTDYCFPSRNLMINSCNDRPRGASISRKKAAWIQLRSVMTQVATFVSQEALKNEDVRVLSFGGTPENAKRLKNYGFTFPGGIMPRTGNSLAEVRYPIKGSGTFGQQLVAYEALACLIRIWRAMLPSPPVADD